MENLYKQIGNKIRELRQNFGVKGISQEDLAKEMQTTANTISRWETAAYKPSAMDLSKLAKFFGVSTSIFFPGEENHKVNALMSALGDLNEDDIHELTEYAQFRKARQTLKKAKK
jgi:transcriptional regulator with XRE-family HTH domain